MKNKIPRPKINNKKLSKNVLKAQNGDKKALEYIINETSTYVYYYCLSMLCDEEKVNDAVQDIYVKVINNLASVKNPKLFLGWLKSVVANHCKNLYAHKQVEDELLDKFIENDVQFIPEKSVESGEICKIIEKVINELPTVQKESILLYYYQQMSVKEISDILGVKEGTVKSRLFTARKSIKEKLEKYGKYNLLSGLSPLNLISYTLFSNAEKYSSKFRSSSLFAMKLSTNKNTLPVTYSAKSFASVLSVKSIAIISSGFITVAGIGACTIASNVSNYNKSSITEESTQSTLKVSKDSVLEIVRKNIKSNNKEYNFKKSKKQVFNIKKKNRKGFTPINNYDYFRYSSNPIYVVLLRNEYKDYKKKLIPSKNSNNDKIWDEISNEAKRHNYAYIDKNGDVWVKYDKFSLYTIAEIDKKINEFLGFTQFEVEDKIDLESIRSEFFYSYGLKI